MPVPPLVAHRWIALLGALCCWVAGALIGVHYGGRTGYGPVDDAVTRTISGIIGNPKPLGKWAVIPPTVPTRILGAFSDTILIYAVIVVIVGYAVWRRRWAAAGLAVVAPGLCALVTEVSKQWFDRYHDGYLAYPSGHMATSAAALTIGMLVIRLRWRAVAWIGWALVMFCTSVGLIAMNYHYPSDTVGGFLLALGVVFPGAVLVDMFNASRDASRLL